jgi:cytidylate kinase
MKIKKNLQIAIDGPVAAGKGTVAYLLSKKLSILYVDTGAMYRAAALLGLENGLDLTKETPLLKLLKETEIKLRVPHKDDGRFCTVLLNGKDVTWKIRKPRVSWGASQVAVFPAVRKHLVKLQKKIAVSQAVIMEGRDITTVVLPKADLKIFMIAIQKERAKRRHLQLKEMGRASSFKAVLLETKKRDKQDSQRKADPLKITKDVWVLDTTELTIPEVIKAILKKLRLLQLIK